LFPHLPVLKDKSVEISSNDSLSSITIHKDGEELSHSMGNFSDDQVLDDVPLSPNKGTNGDENDLPFGPMQLARAHWIQLHKIDMQVIWNYWHFRFYSKFIINSVGHFEADVLAATPATSALPCPVAICPQF
jgi:hypothetical protein